MTISLWLDEHSDEDDGRRQTLGADLAIIGGGITGAAAAYYAHQRGLRNIVVIEAGQIASGASGRNGGFVLRGIHTYYDACVKEYGRETASFVYRFGQDNQSLIKQFVADHGVDIGFDPSGSYLLASSLEESDELSRSARLMQEDGFAVEHRGDDPLDRGFYGALYNECDFGINPVNLVRALLSQSGATILDQQPVRRMEVYDGGGVKIIGSNKDILAKQVIVATNAYLPLLEPSFMDKLVPTRGQMFATAPLKKKLVDKICYANYGWEYFRQLPDRRLVVGGCRQFFLDDEVGFADLVTRGVQSALEHYMKDHFPELAGVAIDYRWSGLMAFTPDGLPLVGEMANLPGVFFATGCNGHGLGYGLNLAKLIVAVGQGDAVPGVFDANRKPASRAAAAAFANAQAASALPVGQAGQASAKKAHFRTTEHNIPAMTMPVAEEGP
jgi:gamma-glutamylputrescine oxidase